MVLAFGAGACGSQATTARQLQECAPDGAAWVTIPAADASAGPAPAELSCPGSISDYCLHYAPTCPAADFAEVVSEQNATGYPGFFTVCKQYNWVQVAWSCGGNTVAFAYDKTTGKLVGAVQVLVSATEDKQICLAGPSTLAPVGDCTAYYDCYLNDAGVMQGHCYGDGGVDGSGDAR